MKRFLWSMGLALAGMFLSAKDIDWTYDSTGHKLFTMLLYGAIAAVIGLCLSIGVEPARSTGRRTVRLLCWTGSFALLGLAVGHGNVPWLVTLRFLAIFTAIGAAIGSLQFMVSTRNRQDVPRDR